jgi:SAM-dependent methyltransferase
MSKKEFDKYEYYEKSVQNPSNEVDLFNEKFYELRRRKAYSLREDFCGTAAISCLWASQSKKHTAMGIDLDPEPIAYGKAHHLAKLAASDQLRMKYVQENVLKPQKEKVDIIFAFNFSYFIFKKRSELVKYFSSVRKSLNKDGVFFLDIFGGADSITEMVDEIRHKKHTYYWDCLKFNPITNECTFAIHFKRDGEKKRENVFVYNWRMWGLSELRDILSDAGFSKSVVYWEGDDNEGGGNGIFTPAEDGENCPAWVTYIAALP